MGPQVGFACSAQPVGDRGQWWRFLAGGAGLVTLLGATVMVAISFWGSQITEESAPQPALSEATRAVLAVLVGGGQPIDDQREQVLAALMSREALLPRGSAAALREGIVALDRTLEDAAAALRRDPTSLELIGLVVRTWRQEARLLRDARRLLERTEVSTLQEAGWDSRRAVS